MDRKFGSVLVNHAVFPIDFSCFPIKLQNFNINIENFFSFSNLLEINHFNRTLKIQIADVISLIK
jgi:hypothetical protein